MTKPLLSVVMPVYNAENFLGKAIASILNQSLTNFELILINDGSTDSSLKIIKDYAAKDSRIVVISQTNQGIVSALNNGIKKTKGKYIARMDADDISRSDRFKEQVDHLETNKNCSIVCSTVELINEQDVFIGYWSEDKQNVSEKQIYQYLPQSTCIAHPSVMARSEFFKEFPYRNVVAAEDYDLWLRAISNDRIIHKINEPLLKYRIHNSSITQQSNETGSPIHKINSAKRFFLVSQLRNFKFNKTEKSVMISLIKPPLYSFVRKIKFLAALPLIVIECIKIYKQVKISDSGKKQLLFLVPWLTMGGADKVVLDLVNGLSSEYDIHIITTEDSPNEWKDFFNKARITNLTDIVRFPINRGVYVARYIKNHKISVTINSNSLKGYVYLPLIKRTSPLTKNFDILHGQGGKIDNGSAPKFSIPYRKYLEKGITVTEYLINYMQETYKLSPEQFVCVHNGISIVDTLSKMQNKYRTQFGISAKETVVLWAGRFSAEKQPLLALEIIKDIHNTEPDCKFIFAGDGVLKETMLAYVEENKLLSTVFFPGKVDDMTTLLSEVDLLMMTSEMEGLPIVILEAISANVPVIATEVGGIPELITDNYNGRLVRYDKNMKTAFVDSLLETISNPAKLETLSRQAKASSRNFTLEKMIQGYKNVIS